ncbi:MAG: hypothetical protein ABIZ81_01005 [Opitutaceae bacterium]
MNFRKTFLFAAFSLASITLAQAADLAGKWTAEFDSQIGVQKYAYEFRVDGDKITGKASYDHSMGKGESEIKNVKLVNDDVSFVETIKIADMDITVTYAGKITGDEIKLTRTVGDFGTEQLVAKRVKTAAKPAAPDPKPAPTK